MSYSENTFHVISDSNMCYCQHKLEKYQKVFFSMYDLEVVTDLPQLFFYPDEISSYC